MKRKLSKSKSTSKRKSILDRAKPVTEMDTGLSCLFYGRSGTGKTTLSGTFPKPILLLDFGEKGQNSVSNVKDLDVYSPESWEEFEEIYWEFQEGNSRYKSVIIDALPGVQQMAIIRAKELAKKKPSDQTSQRDMGEATKLMQVMLYNYRDLTDLGYNVAMLAHDRIRETDSDDEEAIAPEVGPNTMPGISKSIMGAVSVIGVTFIKVSQEKKKIGVATKRNVDYCLRIGPHEIYNTKIRVPPNVEVPEYITDPSYDKLMDIIKGKTAKGNNAARKIKRSIKRK